MQELPIGASPAPHERAEYSGAQRGAGWSLAGHGLLLAMAAYALCCGARWVLLEDGGPPVRASDVWLAAFLAIGETLGALVCGGPLARLPRRRAWHVTALLAAAGTGLLCVRGTPDTGLFPLLFGIALLVLGLTATATLGLALWPAAPHRSRRRRAAATLPLLALAVTALAGALRPFAAENVLLSLIAVSPALAILGLGAVPPASVPAREADAKE